MLNCDKCGILCIDNSALLKHQKGSRLCNKYQDIIFICKKCHFNTKGIKNVEKHIEDNCTQIKSENSQQREQDSFGINLIIQKQEIESQKKIFS